MHTSHFNFFFFTTFDFATSHYTEKEQLIKNSSALLYLKVMAKQTKQTEQREKFNSLAVDFPL